jgi:hypothetical protein
VIENGLPDIAFGGVITCFFLWPIEQYQLSEQVLSAAPA